ncbi:La-related protein 6A [Zea mays]|uniref:La-related protein 6A n=1 Tax=Zea mays TaxID=4577 RepID=A0A1D6NBL1_MAIZE|nr:La-related protein 6A [Zea mays]ONM37907.1 La-related protein 6A [Zea mays]
MDGQAPPLLDAVVLEPLAVGDELHPRRPVEVEDAPAAAPPSGMDGQVPPLYNVTRDPLTVSDELQPTGEVVDDALLVAPDIVKGEVMEDDILPVATDIINDAASECPEAGSDGVVLTDELRNRIVKQVEYYFSDENLPTDEFLLNYVKKNNKGFGKYLSPEVVNFSVNTDNAVLTTSDILVT